MTDPWKIALDHKGLVLDYLMDNLDKIRKSYPHLDFNDFFQIGLMALYSSAIKFDPSRGFKFSTFARKRMVGSILRAFRTQGFPIMKVPEAKHLKSDIEISALNPQETFTYNVLNVRLDLSCVDYAHPEVDENDSDSESFVFFK